MDGKRRRRLENGWNFLASKDHECEKKTCKAENDKLLEITRRNLDKLEENQTNPTIQCSSSSSYEES